MKDVRGIFPVYATEFINLLSKFEVVHELDEKRILIPSLLPDSEEEACIVYSKTFSAQLAERGDLIHTESEEFENLGQQDLQIFCRYYLLPFIPNGFFTRLIARLISSNILGHLQKSLKSDLPGTFRSSSNMHWNCWRSGVDLVWNSKEIFRVAPLSITDSSDSKIILIAKPNDLKICSSLCGLEIKVAVIPEHRVRACAFLEPALQRMREGSSDIYPNLDNPTKGKCIASWLLHTTTSIVHSVFKDWYNGFGSREYDDDSSTPDIANYCSQCLRSVHQSAYSDVISNLYMFSSMYCCLATYKGQLLECPTHGMIEVEDVAPDLVSTLKQDLLYHI